MSRKILFLCTGNYYRSRFAEILFNALATQRHLDARATSRGLKIGWPGNIGALSRFAEQRLAEMNIPWDDSRHMPMQCRECDLVDADLVIALKEAEHRAMLEQRFPAWPDRVKYWHVHDVDEATPETALAEIEERVECLIRELSDSRRS